MAETISPPQPILSPEMKATLKEGSDKGEVQQLFAIALLTSIKKNNTPPREALRAATNVPTSQEHNAAFEKAYEFLIQHASEFGIDPGTPQEE